MSGALSDSDGEGLSQLEYYYSPTSQREEEAPGELLSPDERRKRENERRQAVVAKIENHRKEFGAFVKAKTEL